MRLLQYKQMWMCRTRLSSVSFDWD